MLRIIGCISQDHDLRLVALAGILCLAACLTAVSMIARAEASQGRWRTIWTIATGFVLGGAIWSTHFVAMLGFRPEIPFSYDLWRTLASVILAISLSIAGIWASLHKSRAIIGGLLLGIAIITMHYVGMAAINLPGTLNWDMDYVYASILVGLLFAILTIKFSINANTLALRGVGALCGTLAICGMHFISMSGVLISYDPTVNIPASTITPLWLAIGIFTITTVIIALALLGALIDNHLARRAVRETTRLRAHVTELEATKQKLETTTGDLQKALEAAAASNRAKSQFLATMSHELRTPLNAIIGFSEILATELFGPLGNERYLEYANDVQNSGAHLLGLINDILDFSKVDAGQLHLECENVTLKQIIEDSIRMVRQQVEHQDIILTSHIEPDLPDVFCDHRRIKQVLLNLLSNATKFTGDGGTIIVSAFTEGDRIGFSVSDTGIGIADADIPRALERFGQIDGALNRKYQGTGLGLPLSKGLLELHDGTLSLKSELGVGTCVTALFPSARTVKIRAVA
jgi:signal transduction histidine kinase